MVQAGARGQLCHQGLVDLAALVQHIMLQQSFKGARDLVPGAFQCMLLQCKHMGAGWCLQHSTWLVSL